MMINSGAGKRARLVADYKFSFTQPIHSESNKDDPRSAAVLRPESTQRLPVRHRLPQARPRNAAALPLLNVYQTETDDDSSVACTWFPHTKSTAPVAKTHWLFRTRSGSQHHMLIQMASFINILWAWHAPGCHEQA